MLAQLRSSLIPGSVAVWLAAAAASQDVAPRRLANALDTWRAAWWSLRLEVDDSAFDGRRPARPYTRVLGEGELSAEDSHRRGLGLLLDRAVASNDRAVATAVVQLLATSIGSGARPRHRVDVIREAVLAAIARHGAPPAAPLWAAMVSGERDAIPRGAHARIGPAAVLALGNVAHPFARAPIAAALESEDRLRRMAASQAAIARADPGLVAELADALATETERRIARQLATALVASLRAATDPLEPAALEAIVATAAAALGRHDWTTDLAIVDVCGVSRARAGIPALVSILERPARSGEAAGGAAIVRERAHTTLRAMTGAVWAADDLDAWRRFRDEDATRAALLPASRPAPDNPRRTTSGPATAEATPSGPAAPRFAGIPVRGRRVLFVIDASGSMFEPHPPLLHPDEEPTTRRFDFARDQLLGCIDALPDDAQFTVVTFGLTARRLSEEPLPKSQRWVAHVRAEISTMWSAGPTNLWAGLAEAFAIRSLDWDRIEPPPVDEVFVLSDGKPSTGDLEDPDEIVAAVTTVNSMVGARIHTVGFGSGDSELLRRLAAENRGQHVRADGQDGR